MGDEPRVEGKPNGSAEKSKVDVLADAVQQLVQLKIAESAQPKPIEIPQTDPNTRLDHSTPPAEVVDGAALTDRRFGPVSGKSSFNFATGKAEVVEKYQGGFIRPLGYDDRKSINVNSFPRGDLDNFSLSRFAFAQQRAHYMGTDARKEAPWECMYYDALGKILYTDPVTKAQGDQVSGQDGGFLAPEFWANNFYDQLYAAQVVTQLPITTMPMGYRVVHMPKLTSAITISYSSENSALATTQAAFQQLSFTARKQGEIVQISNELIRDAVPAADQILRNHAIRWMALDRDKQLLKGTGQAGAPVGLLNVGGAGVTTTTLASAGAPFFSEFLTGIVNVETLNGSTNAPLGMTQCSGVFGHPILKSQILSMKDSTSAATGRPEYDYTGMNAMRGSFPAAGGGAFDGLFGVPTWRFSNILNESANSRSIIFGDWQWLVYMVRLDLEIMVSNVAGTAFASDQTWLRFISRYDVGVAHPEAFFAFTNG